MALAPFEGPSANEKRKSMSQRPIDDHREDISRVALHEEEQTAAVVDAGNALVDTLDEVGADRGDRQRAGRRIDLHGLGEDRRLIALALQAVVHPGLEAKDPTGRDDRVGPRATQVEQEEVDAGERGAGPDRGGWRPPSPSAGEARLRNPW